MKTGVLPLPPLYWILRAATSCADKAQVGAWRTAFCARHTRCLLSTHCRNWRPGFAFAKTPALSRYCRGMGEPIGTSRLEIVMKHTYGILLVVAGAFAFPLAAQQPLDADCSAAATQATGTLPARTRGRKPAAASAERRRARRRERQSVRCRVTSTTMLPGAFRTQTRRTRPRRSRGRHGCGGIAESAGSSPGQARSGCLAKELRRLRGAKGLGCSETAPHLLN